MEFIPVREISKTFGPPVCDGQLFFHVFSNCNTPSSSCGKDKKLFFESWKKFSELTSTFAKLSSSNSSPSQISESDFQELEQFVVCLCSSTVNTCEVNLARRILFAKGGRTVKNIPPILDALKQHIKPSAFQAIK